MIKYFYLQLKRTARLFPFVLMTALILLFGLIAIFFGLMRMQSESEDVKKFRVGIVGDTDNVYLNFGLSALKVLDDTRFSLELELLEAPEARQALERHDISAYVEFPEDFVEAALRGDVKPIRMVTRAGDGGLVLMFKEELAQAVTDLVIESQKGTYGVQTALDSNGYPQLSYEYLNKISIEYVDLVFHRTDLYSVTELGISDGLPLTAYYFCSFAVLLLLLIGLPYAAVFIKKDWSLNRILASGRCRAAKQVICEYAAYTAFLLLLAAVIAAILAVLAAKLRQFAPVDLEFLSTSLALRMIPVILTAAALHMMLFELAGNIVTGILLQFFCSIALCYAAGCFYPIYAFPKAVQTLASFLPTGLMRGCLASGITGGSPAELFGLLAFTAVFLGAAIAARRHKITAKAG